jgi:hypothetical protein
MGGDGEATMAYREGEMWARGAREEEMEGIIGAGNSLRLSATDFTSADSLFYNKRSVARFHCCCFAIAARDESGNILC